MDFIKTANELITVHDKAYFFVFSSHNILVKEELDNFVSIPCIEEKALVKMKLNGVCSLGKVKNFSCYCGRITPENIPDKYKMINLRALYGKIDNGFWSIAGYARQICDWNMNFKFCGRCGAQTKTKKDEHARVCPKCNLTSYPRISPAIITAVVKDKQILLGRGVNFPDKKRAFKILCQLTKS